MDHQSELDAASNNNQNQSKSPRLVIWSDLFPPAPLMDEITGNVYWPVPDLLSQSKEVAYTKYKLYLIKIT